MKALLFIALILPALALGEPPPRPFSTFHAAKRVARDGIYADQRTDFYCGCAFTASKNEAGGLLRPAPHLVADTERFVRHHGRKTV